MVLAEAENCKRFTPNPARYTRKQKILQDAWNTIIPAENEKQSEFMINGELKQALQRYQTLCVILFDTMEAILELLTSIDFGLRKTNQLYRKSKWKKLGSLNQMKSGD